MEKITLYSALAFLLIGLCWSVSGLCTSFRINTIQTNQVDTVVHNPMGNLTFPSTWHCVRTCLHVQSCNSVNYEPSTDVCLLFNVTSTDASLVQNPDLLWQLVDMTQVQKTTLPNLCDMNSCTDGQACFKYPTGNICHNLILKPE